MKRYLLIGTCAAFLAGSGYAFAQMPPGPGGDAPHGSMGSDDRPDMMEHHMDMMERMHHHHHHGDEGGMAHGTAFHFKKGDAEVDIACSDREAVAACVSGATALLDKLMNNTAPAKPTQ